MMRNFRVFNTSNWRLPILLHALLVTSLLFSNAVAQTTQWTGSVSNDWNNIGNWANGLPSSSNGAVIGSTSRSPVISSVVVAVVKSVVVESGGVLTIEKNGSLKIDGAVNCSTSSATGLDNAGTIDNYGSILIGSVSCVGAYGIINRNIINNEAGGVIRINGFNDTGLYNAQNGIFSNKDTMAIGDASTQIMWVHGIFNESTFNNESTGYIRVNRSNQAAIRNFNNTFTNSGTIVIGNIASVVLYGIRNHAVFKNTAGSIHIDDCTDTGIYNNSGTFINSAPITIGSVKTVGVHGIYNESTFTNKGEGIITIKRTVATGILNTVNSSFTNTEEAEIHVGAVSAGKFGIQNESTFLNTLGATITVDKTTNVSGSAAISNLGSASFTNSKEAVITIGATGTVLYGISNAGTFLNTREAVIAIEDAKEIGLRNLTPAGNFTNDSSAYIRVKAKGDGLTGINNYTNFTNKRAAQITIDNLRATALVSSGAFINESSIIIGAGVNTRLTNEGLSNGGTFQNQASGDIQIDNIKDYGLSQGYLYGSFDNYGSITIGANSSAGEIGFRAAWEVNNYSTGVIRIDRTSENGLLSFGKPFKNYGKLIIGEKASVGLAGISVSKTFTNEVSGTISVGRAGKGVELSGEGTFTNSGILTIGSATEPVTNLLFQTSAQTGIFTSNSGGSIKGSGSINVPNFSHNGGAISPGYSPGTISFSGNQDFTNSILTIEVAGIGTAGTDFDRVVVSGAATLAGTLALSVTHAGVDGDEVIILTATSVTGQFGTVTGLPAGWEIVYGSTDVRLVYDITLPVTLIEFKAKASGSASDLRWKTVGETNNAGFFIERSSNASKWEDIGFVDGSATTFQQQSYSFADKNPMGGSNYYRLRQIDFDGKFEHSRIEQVRFANRESDLIVWVNDLRQAQIQSVEEIKTVTVFDLTGRELLTTQTTTAIDLASVADGLLLIHVQTVNGFYTRKLLLK